MKYALLISLFLSTYTLADYNEVWVGGGKCYITTNGVVEAKNYQTLQWAIQSAVNSAQLCSCAAYVKCDPIKITTTKRTSSSSSSTSAQTASSSISSSSSSEPIAVSHGTMYRPIAREKGESLPYEQIGGYTLKIISADGSQSVQNVPSMPDPITYDIVLRDGDRVQVATYDTNRLMSAFVDVQSVSNSAVVSK